MSTRIPRLLRILLPALLIVAWLVGASAGGPLFGRVEEVSSNDRTTYLPESADATRVQQQIESFTDSNAVPAVVVIEGEGPLTATELQAVADRLGAVTGVEGVAEGVSPPIPSDDGHAVQAFVPIDSSADITAAIDNLGTELRTGLPDGLTVYVTGPAGFTADLAAGFAGIDGLLLGVALGAVLLILIVVYRSLLLPVAVLSTSVFALCVALLTVWWLAKSGVLLLSGQTQGILFILVIGAATDYSLLYVARYREALQRMPGTWQATQSALRGAFEPIVASGSTVIAGLLCLLLSDLKSNSSLGPVAAIGIVFAMLAALTFLPAVLHALGRASFWPRRPNFDSQLATEDRVPTTGVWARTARAISRRPRTIWVVTAVLLGIAALGVPQLRVDGVAQSELVLGQSDARDGQRVLGERFPDGAGSPIYVLTDAGQRGAAAEALYAEDTIDSVALSATGSPSGTVPLTRAGEIDTSAVAGPPPGVGPAGPTPEPTVVNGRVLLQGTMNVAADSQAAENTVRDLRVKLAQLPGEALVGGVTATSVDTNDTAIADRTLIIPVVLAVILLILMVLLRSIVAPVLLIATTVLSFASAMGVSALVFNEVLGFPGADPAVPLYGFVFLVALGIDYNIFLMTRVREETVTHGAREGVLRGLIVTGGVITSAGVVLAATFAALAVIPILFLVQLAFIVAFGVLLDTFVVRSLLVPALVHDIGRHVWWPSKLSRRHDPTPDSDSGATGPDVPASDKDVVQAGQ